MSAKFCSLGRCYFGALLLGLVVLSVCGPIQAQTATLLSLTEVYQKARTQDAQFRAAQKTMEAGLEKLPQARAALLPTVTLTGSAGRQLGEASFSEAPYVSRDVQTRSWSAQIAQPLFRRASWLAYSQADAQTRQAITQFALAEQDLLLRSAQAYTDVVLASQNLQVAKNQVLALTEQLTLADRTYAVGTGTVTDVQEARAKLALAEAQKIAADNDLTVKNAELEKLLGESVAPVTVPLSIAPVNRDRHPTPVEALEPVSYWLGAAAAENLQVKLQEAALATAQLETAKNRSAHWPTLDLTLNRSGNYNSGSLGSPADISTLTVSNQVSLQLSVPLYAGGATQSRVRESLALEEKAREDLVLAQRSASTQTRQAYAGVVNGQAQVAALQTAVEAGRNAVESNKIGLKIGTRITPDVLSAEQQLFASLRDYYKARMDVAMQKLKLKAATGQLYPDDLLAVDALLQ